MEPGGSLPHSKSPPPVPILSHFSLVHPTSWSSVLILSSHLRPRISSGLFPSDFPTIILYATCHNPHLIHLDFIVRIIFGGQYKSCAGPHYVVFSTPLLPRPFEAKYSATLPVWNINQCANGNFAFLRFMAITKTIPLWLLSIPVFPSYQTAERWSARNRGTNK